MTLWFNKCSKSISINFHRKHFKMMKAWNNGAVKGRKEDTCFDFNIHFLGIFFSYTNWDYNNDGN